jgi:hypothetical protein
LGALASDAPLYENENHSRQTSQKVSLDLMQVADARSIISLDLADDCLKAHAEA